ncbi:MAG: acetylxylan esterase [Lentisphaeria bacterium]|nr:acetylxylan esterase [Lentisphaeria bacterium]
MSEKSCEANWKPYSIDEKDVPEYTLPDPLRTTEGRHISTAIEWVNGQRERILQQLKDGEYGEILPRPDSTRFELLAQRNDALDNTAIRKEFRIHCSMENGRSFAFDMLLYLPKNATGPVPAFLGLNFKGNHNTTDEKDVRCTGFIKPGMLAVEERSLQADRWCFREAVRRGFASATLCYHDIHPDATHSEQYSAFSLFFTPEQYPDIQKRYSVIGCWAWGLSRALECLEHDPMINPAKIAVHGHSRLGKTALWAGAIEKRFRMVISNNSGCGGAALHRRKFGENLSQHFEAHENSGVPVWFVKKCHDYIGCEETMPFDQHELLAMAAPRPLAIATATEDFYADPKGEFLAAKAASEVYALFASKGLDAAQMPQPDQYISGDISFHYRTGKHDQTPFDWEHYFALAEKFLK